MKRTGLLLTVTAGLLMAVTSAWGWQGAPNLKSTLSPMRTVSLPAGQDASRWAAQNGVSNWQLQSGQDGRQHLNFRAADEQWQQLSSQCEAASASGIQCAPDSCQGIRADQSETASYWLSPRAPDLNGTLAGRPESCPRDLQSQPWSGTFPSGSDPACWDLQQSLPCQSEETPAEYIEPHWRPNLLLVALPAGGEDAAALAARTGLRLLDEITLKSTGDRLVRLLRIDTGTPLDGWVSLLQADAGVLSAQKDFAYFTMATGRNAAPPVATAFSSALGDPLSGFNYGPVMTGSGRLLERYTGDQIRVAVIDTGVDLTHPELSSAILDSTDYTDRGYSADAHGTAVAAIIAGARNNGVGASGVAPEVKISSFKACHPRQPGGLAAQCWNSSLIRALDDALSQDIPLINMSLGGPPSPLLERLLKAAESSGQLVLAAAGNGGPNARPVYPAALPQSLAVTAVDTDKRLYRMANRGNYISVAAPGVDIITAGPGGAQPLLSGTSMATAHATGIAAMLMQADPRLVATDIARLLESTTEDLGPAGSDAEFGAGLLKACRSASQLADVSVLCGGEL